MPLFPYEHLQIKTPLSLQAARERLSEQVETRRPSGRWFWEGHKPYEGEVEEDGFNISRITYQRKHSRPEIRGTFKAAPGGCRVHVTIQPNLWQCFSLLVGILLWVSMAAMTLKSMVTSSGAFSEDTLTCLLLGFVVFPLIIWGSNYISTRIEMTYSKDFLLELLEGQEANEDDA